MNAFITLAEVATEDVSMENVQRFTASLHK